MNPYFEGIPRFFAIMDDQPRDGTASFSTPVYKQRYKICSLLDATPCFTKFFQYKLQVDKQESYSSEEYPFKIHVESGTPASPHPHEIRMAFSWDWNGETMRYWETGQKVFVKAIHMWIPVIDTADRTQPLWRGGGGGRFLFTAMEDSSDDYQERVLQQINLREIMLPLPPLPPNKSLDGIPWRAPPSQPRPSAPLAPVTPQPVRPVSSVQAPTQYPPAFVASAILKDAISKGETCSISLNSFEECETITLTSCYHLFDTASLKSWMATKKECPLCKKHIAFMMDCPRDS